MRTRAATGTATAQVPLAFASVRGPTHRHPLRPSSWISITILALATLGCSPSHGPAMPHQVLHRGLSGEPATLDPAAAADTFSSEVIEDLYEGLTATSPDGGVIPGVAASWTVDASGTQYTFQLRPDAAWSNGKPVRAQDFITAWQRTLDPKQASPNAEDLRLIVGAADILAGKVPVSALGAQAHGDSALIVTLTHPAPYFPQLLTHPAAYPIYSEGAAHSRDPTTWVSNGAYVLAAWSPTTEVSLAQNPHYWNRTGVSIPHVDYVITSDDHAQFGRYRAGEIDLTDTVPDNAIAELRQEHATEFLSAPRLATAYYGLNLVSGPLKSSAPLRQALSMAIDRQRLVTSLGGGQVPAFSFVPPGTWNFSPQASPWKGIADTERVAEARRLYAGAGYSSGTPLHLRLLFNTSSSIKNTALVVASMWREVLGIEVELVEEEYRVFLESRHDHSRWEVARLAWNADFDDASNFLETLRQQSANNDPGYANSGFDQLLDSAATSADPSHRRELLEKGEQLMLADTPIVPLYFLVSKRLVKPYVHGAVANPTNRIRSQSLSLAAQ